MKREKTYHGYYHKMRKRDKKYRYLVGGRSPINMSDRKHDEYFKLRWYILTDGDIISYGYVLALYRFYKNMKYRKRYIKLYKKMKGR